jgi:hypothetical protein
MSIVDRLNRWIAARVHAGRPQLVVEGQHLTLQTETGERETFWLSELTQATLSHRDVYAGDAVVLHLGFSDGRHLEVFQDHPLWFDLMTALDQSGMIPVPSADWQLQFLAAGDGGPMLDLMALSRA